MNILYELLFATTICVIACAIGGIIGIIGGKIADYCEELAIRKIRVQYPELYFLREKFLIKDQAWEEAFQGWVKLGNQIADRREEMKFIPDENLASFSCETNSLKKEYQKIRKEAIILHAERDALEEQLRDMIKNEPILFKAYKKYL